MVQEDDDEIDDTAIVVKQPLYSYKYWIIHRFPYIDDDAEYDEYGIKYRKEYEPVLIHDDDDDDDDGMDIEYYKVYYDILILWYVGRRKDWLFWLWSNREWFYYC